MEYIDIEIKIPSLPPETDETLQGVLAFYLGELSYDSFWYDDEEKRLHAYIPLQQYSEEKLNTVLREQTFLASFAPWDYTVHKLEDVNWNEEWEKHYFQPIEVIPGKVIVRASFHPASPHIPLEIIIDPKMAFGTGNHATTSGMMRLIDTIPLKGKVVLDMGCGSGILGIYAKKKGARRCTSIDIDHWSVRNAQENAFANDVELDILHGDARLLEGHVKTVDLFLANINRNIILQDLPYYINTLNIGADILLSGFLKKDIPMIEKSILSYGYVMHNQVNVAEEWVALHFKRP